MTSITPQDLIPAEVSPAEPARPRLLILATSLVVAATSMGFAGLIGTYLSQRAAVLAEGGVWLSLGEGSSAVDVAIPLTQPNYMAFTLSLSVVTMVWAVQAIKNDDRSNCYVALGLTLMFGFAFIAQTAYLLTLLEIPITVDRRAVLIYAIIGSHLVLTGIAMAFVAVMGLRTLGGEYSAKDQEGVLSATIFWTATVVIYMALWFAIYITK